MERPNHRLAALLAGGGFARDVAREQARSESAHGRAPWWQPERGVLLRPESMDGAAAAASGDLHRHLLADAARIIAAAGGTVVPPDAHHDDLRDVLEQARGLVPDGLTRIGALVEAPGRDLLHGGPLDGQTIELTAAPQRAVVLPYGRASGVSGEGEQRHAFVAVTTSRRLRSAYELDGVPLPDDDLVPVLRTTVFEGDERVAILLLPVDGPDAIAEDTEDTEVTESVPVYVSVMSSAVAIEPERTAAWMRAVDPDRVSLVMDTPATAALHRWCAHGARFHTETRAVGSGAEEVRVIVGRLQEPGRRSPLVVIPSTEFGARWFEAARMEDDLLRTAVVDDEGLFDRESAHLDVVLTHLLLEERYLGTGSWRR